MILRTLVAMAQNKIKILLMYTFIGHVILLLTFHEEPWKELNRSNWCAIYVLMIINVFAMV
jgi:hypothetical protein